MFSKYGWNRENTRFSYKKTMHRMKQEKYGFFLALYIIINKVIYFKYVYILLIKLIPDISLQCI